MMFNIKDSPSHPVINLTWKRKCNLFYKLDIALNNNNHHETLEGYRLIAQLHMPGRTLFGNYLIKQKIKRENQIWYI
jgi:hypothetical protein